MIDLHYLLQLTLGGLTKGSIYALIALGYTMVYGIVKLINFAHGEIYMLGAFTAMIIGSALTMAGLPSGVVLWISLFSAVIFCAGYGFTIERIAYKPLRGAPRLTALISAIGVSMFLQQYIVLAQTSDFIPFPLQIDEIAFLEPVREYLNPAQFLIMVTTAVVMLLLTVLIKCTRMGKAMRATAQDKEMACLVGINVNHTISMTFVIGSATAGIGGVLVGSYLGQINFYMGFIAGIKAFVAAVLGGIGSIPGAVLGGFVLGFTESYGAGYISSSYEDAFAFVILILILVLRPSGILGRKENQKV